MPLSTDMWPSKLLFWLLEAYSMLFVYLSHLCNHKLDRSQILLGWMVPLDSYWSNKFPSHPKQIIFDVFSETKAKDEL